MQLVAKYSDNVGAHAPVITEGRADVPSRPLVTRWPCPSWAGCTTNISELEFPTGTPALGVPPVYPAIKPDNANPHLSSAVSESALECLRERIDLIGIAPCRKGHELTTEFIEPGGAARQRHRPRLDPSRLRTHTDHFVALGIDTHSVNWRYAICDTPR